jgi:prepilin-type N-terminal cleavage/methylation domain-containing protein
MLIPITTLRKRHQSPRGFTLVELLVVIVIIGILSSMVLMAISNTQNSAREARTRTTIAKLDALIMAKWETYQTRRVPIAKAATGSARSVTYTNRLNALRDLMRLEMPDVLMEVTTAPSVVPLPAVTKTYKNKLAAATPEVSSAECLYQIVAYGLRDPDALSQFNESEIADTDGDGCKEFIDGWGQPIFFLRWAPGFDSPLHKHAPENIGGKMIQMPHDPFDPMMLDQDAFAIYPLIYSAGPDKIRDIKNANASGTERTINKPYADNNGESLGDGSLDNITNHELLAN